MPTASQARLRSSSSHAPSPSSRGASPSAAAAATATTPAVPRLRSLRAAAEAKTRDPVKRTRQSSASATSAASPRTHTEQSKSRERSNNYNRNTTITTTTNNNGSRKSTPLRRDKRRRSSPPPPPLSSSSDPHHSHDRSTSKRRYSARQERDDEVVLLTRMLAGIVIRYAEAAASVNRPGDHRRRDRRSHSRRRSSDAKSEAHEVKLEEPSLEWLRVVHEHFFPLLPQSDDDGASASSSPARGSASRCRSIFLDDVVLQCMMQSAQQVAEGIAALAAAAATSGEGTPRAPEDKEERRRRRREEKERRRRQRREEAERDCDDDQKKNSRSHSANKRQETQLMVPRDKDKDLDEICQVLAEEPPAAIAANPNPPPPTNLPEDNTEQRLRDLDNCRQLIDALYAVVRQQREQRQQQQQQQQQQSPQRQQEEHPHALLHCSAPTRRTVDFSTPPETPVGAAESESTPGTGPDGDPAADAEWDATVLRMLELTSRRVAHDHPNPLLYGPAGVPDGVDQYWRCWEPQHHRSAEKRVPSTERVSLSPVSVAPPPAAAEQRTPSAPASSRRADADADAEAEAADAALRQLRAEVAALRAQHALDHLGTRESIWRGAVSRDGAEERAALVGSFYTAALALPRGGAPSPPRRPLVTPTPFERSAMPLSDSNAHAALHDAAHLSTDVSDADLCPDAQQQQQQQRQRNLLRDASRLSGAECCERSHHSDDMREQGEPEDTYRAAETAAFLPTAEEQVADVNYAIDDGELGGDAAQQAEEPIDDEAEEIGSISSIHSDPAAVGEGIAGVGDAPADMVTAADAAAEPPTAASPPSMVLPPLTDGRSGALPPRSAPATRAFARTEGPRYGYCAGPQVGAAAETESNGTEPLQQIPLAAAPGDTFPEHHDLDEGEGPGRSAPSQPRAPTRTRAPLLSPPPPGAGDTDNDSSSSNNNDKTSSDADSKRGKSSPQKREKEENHSVNATSLSTYAPAGTFYEDDGEGSESHTDDDKSFDDETAELFEIAPAPRITHADDPRRPPRRWQDTATATDIAAGTATAALHTMTADMTNTTVMSFDDSGLLGSDAGGAGSNGGNDLPSPPPRVPT